MFKYIRLYCTHLFIKWTTLCILKKRTKKLGYIFWFVNSFIPYTTIFLLIKNLIKESFLLHIPRPSLRYYMGKCFLSSFVNASYALITLTEWDVPRMKSIKAVMYMLIHVQSDCLCIWTHSKQRQKISQSML